MSPSDPLFARYHDGGYLARNPTWDDQDAPWKAARALAVLRDCDLSPTSIADVGCGAGGVLAALHAAFPDAALEGYDVAADAERFWSHPRSLGIELRVGDFLALSRRSYDLILLFDVLEHLADPFAFLGRLRGRARRYLFHFPLDLSALSVLRERPLLHVREKVGHVHYYTRGLAHALLEDCGYRIVESRYTGAALTAPQRGLRARLAALPRRLGYAVAKDFSVRLLGGETLMVLAADAGDRP